MNSLLNSDYQKLTFKIEISLDNEGLILRSRKNDPKKNQIILEESTDGKSFKPMSFETFESKYNLIYDIPNNPTERLYDLIEELKKEQLRYGNKFKEFSWFLRDTIKDITQHRDPERLEKLKSALNQAIAKRNGLVKELPKLEEFLDLLERHAYATFYCFYLNECKKLKEARDGIVEKSKQFTKRERKLGAISKKLTEEIARLQGTIASDYYEVTPLIKNALPKNEKSRFEIWKRINPYDTGEYELYRIKTEMAHLRNLFGSQIEKMESEDAFKDASLLEKIIQSLIEFENSSFVIPKIKVTIKELVEILKDENKKHYFLISKFDNLRRIEILLRKLRENIETLKEDLRKIQDVSSQSTELTSTYSESYYETQSQLRSLTDKLDKAKEKCVNYFHKCLSKGLDKKLLEEGMLEKIMRNLHKPTEELKPFLSLSEKQIQEKIVELEEEITDKRDRVKSMRIYIEQYQKEKESLEKQKPHKYEKYRAQMQDLLQKTESISQKLLNEYNNHVRNLMQKKVKKTDVEKHENERRYFEEVSRYLAYRIGFFKHIDTTYKAKIVDLISGVIITDDDLKIHLADMGTGQSQSAYLLGLLNVRDDNRKIIALFDEIAMMDDSSLKPIYEKIRELYMAKRLLLGILVQKGNKINVKSLE